MTNEIINIAADIHTIRNCVVAVTSAILFIVIAFFFITLSYFFYVSSISRNLKNRLDIPKESDILSDVDRQ